MEVECFEILCFMSSKGRTTTGCVTTHELMASYFSIGDYFADALVVVLVEDVGDLSSLFIMSRHIRETKSRSSIVQ